MASRKIARKDDPSGRYHDGNPVSQSSKKDGDKSQVRSVAKARLGSALAVSAAPGIRVPEATHQPIEGLLHELQVHQIEPETQNESLRQSLIALEESRDRYVDLYDFAPAGYLTLNDKGLIVEINLTGAAMLGADRATLRQGGLSRSIAAEDRERWHQHFASALQVDANLNCEVALLRQDGTRLDVRLDGLCLAKDSGAPKLRVVLTDISKRKRAEQALVESEERFGLFMDTLPAAASIKDKNSSIVYANRYSSGAIGAQSGLGRANLELFPPELVEKMIADELAVSDEGCGFDPTAFHDNSPGRGTFGLNSICERVTNIGGKMEIDSRPGNGTTVTLSVPCSNAAKENQT